MRTIRLSQTTSTKLGRNKYVHLENFVNKKRLIRNAVKPLAVSGNEIKEIDIEEFNK